MMLDSLEILRSLVAFPTVSRESNLRLIEWVRNYLADHNIESHLVPNAEGTKANLFATVGPARAGGIVFSGHTDVVPVDGQAWISDPFRLTARGSRLHGRGACDMKGFIAAVLSRVPAWKQARLERPVHLMLSYDEEVGCLGVSSMITAARKLIPEPGTVLVGEPTGMRVATQHKGICLARTKVVGIEAHSSLTHQGESAVMLAGELIAYLADAAQKLAAAGPAGGSIVEPPYTTISVNRISGGTTNNILAGLCEFIWDIRPVPGESAESVLKSLASHAQERLAQLAALGKRCQIETTVLADVPALQAEADGIAAEFVRAAMAEREADIAVPFGTEGGYFQRAGWSTVVCGPGSIDVAHRPDEFIEHGQLAECEALLDRLVTRLQQTSKA
jgi:acetylornithine deacetylase